MKIHSAVGSVLFMAMLAGCSTNAAVDNSDFGDSVREMVRAQTYNPNAAAQGTAIPKDGLMGDKAAAAMKSYRSGSQPSSAPESFTAISVPSGAAATPSR